MNKEIESKLKPEFHKLRDSKTKLVKDAIDWTEQRIAQKSKEEQKEVVATANKMLAQGVQVFQNEIQALAQKHYDRALEQFRKTMKMKVFKAKAKAVARITIIVLLTLTTAALAIAATAVSGGALAPIILGAIVTGATALYKSYKAVGDGWANASNQIKMVTKDVEALKAAAAELAKLNELQTSGDKKAMDSVKKLRTFISGKMVNLKKHVDQLAKYAVQTKQALDKQTAELEKITDGINKSGDGALKAQANTLLRNQIEAKNKLAAIDNVKAEAAAAKRAWDSSKAPDWGKYDTALKMLAPVASILIDIGKGSTEVFKGAKKLASA